MSRQLDLAPLKKLRNPKRHIRSLQIWSRTFEGFFPSPDMTYRGLWYEKIPIYQKVISPPRTTPELQKQCAECLIDAAIFLREARPAELEIARVYVYLTFPDMFHSFVEVAFEPNPHLFFNNKGYLGRSGDDRCWQEGFVPKFDRVAELGLRVPSGFEVLGTGLRAFDAEWMSDPMESDEWAIGEVA